MDGALIVDKPSGPTSHDVVAVARRALQTRQIGHAGTLDPLATGVLVLLVGRATRLSRYIVLDEKEYLAGIRLGLATPTYDAEALADDGPAAAVPRFDDGDPRLSDVLGIFHGSFLQTPPPYSAKKIAGRRAYDHARKAQPVEMVPVQVTVRELERLDSPEPSLLRLRLVVSSGFYVRSLAHDIGQRLGCGAHLESLRRVRSGSFAIADAVPLDDLVRGSIHLRPMNRLVEHIPAVVLSDEGLRLASHGNAVGTRHVAGPPTPAARSGPMRLLGPGGELVAIGHAEADGLLHPQVVLV